MDDEVHMTCFGRSSKSKKNIKSRKSKTPALNISPLSSINSDDVIKAHRLEIVEKISTPQTVDCAAELSRERAHRQSLEDQLAASLNINAELKLALVLKEEESKGEGTLTKKLERMRAQLAKEREEKKDSEVQLAASKRESAALRAALNAARAQRADLEAELMEAALDVMDSEKQRIDFETLIKKEKLAREAAEAASAEAEGLRHKLTTTECARDVLEQKLQAMALEASDWELALDALQERLETALLHRPLESKIVTAFDAYAPTTPSPVKEAGNETVIQADTTLEGGLKRAPKPEPWRQVVIDRQML